MEKRILEDWEPVRGTEQYLLVQRNSVWTSVSTLVLAYLSLLTFCALPLSLNSFLAAQNHLFTHPASQWMMIERALPGKAVWQNGEERGLWALSAWVQIPPLPEVAVWILFRWAPLGDLSRCVSPLAPRCRLDNLQTHWAPCCYWTRPPGVCPMFPPLGDPFLPISPTWKSSFAKRPSLKPFLYVILALDWVSSETLPSLGDDHSYHWEQCVPQGPVLLTTDHTTEAIAPHHFSVFSL